jgi:hypothetical protein
MFLLDMAFFFIFIFMSIGIVFIHRRNSLMHTTKKGSVDGTYWGKYSQNPTPAPVPNPSQDHGAKVVNGMLVLPKVQRGSAAALAGKTTYGGKR